MKTIKEMIERNYIDYKLYSVIKLKNKYGFRVLLMFDDETKELIQYGGFDKKSDAIKERDIIAAKLYNHSFVAYPKILFKDYALYWLGEIIGPKLTYDSYMSYRNIIKNYAIQFFDNIYINNINIGHIQRFYILISEKSYSVAKLAKAVMASIMKDAKKRNLIENNPTLKISLPKNEKSSSYRTIYIDKDKVLNIEQIKKLIEASKDTPIYLQILFAVLMGLRKQEINGIRYSDIDFINRKLYLKEQIGRQNTDEVEELKSKKMLTKQRIKLKTKNSERVLDIPDYLFEVILEERKKYEKNKRRRINDKNNPFLDQGYVCCSTYGKPRSKGFHNRYYNKIFEENDLPRIRFHDLRHTYATLLLTNNYGVKAVSELLGHGSTIITTKVYFDKSKVIIDCSEKMNDYINRVIPKEEKKSNEILLNNLDTNLIVSKYL